MSLMITVVVIMMVVGSGASANAAGSDDGNYAFLSNWNKFDHFL